MPVSNAHLGCHDILVKRMKLSVVTLSCPNSSGGERQLECLLRRALKKIFGEMK